MNILSRTSAIIIASVLLTACINEDTVDGPVDMTMWDIATFEGNTAGRAVFTTWSNTGQPVTLTAGEAVESESIEAGKRVYIMYIPLDNRPYVSTDITLRGISMINNGNVKTDSPGIPSNWDDDPVYLISAWTTGNYLNIYCRLPYSQEPRRFGLAADGSTLGTASPEVYLIHDMPSAVNTFDRAYYASFDISALLSDPATETITLHVNNSNLPQKTFTFPR